MRQNLNDYFQLPVNFVRPGMLAGPHNPLFLKNIGLMKEIIKQFKLEKVNMPEIQSGMKTESAEMLDLSRIKPWWIHGGIRVAHIHVNGDTYLLNDEQWKEFSSKVLHELKSKIDKANSINFSQALELADAVESL